MEIVWGKMACGCRVVIDLGCMKDSKIDYCKRHSGTEEVYEALADLTHTIFIGQPQSVSSADHQALQQAMNKANQILAGVIK